MIRTERRLTTQQIATRHVSVTFSEPQLVESTVEGGGSRPYDIWPDCGTQIMSYTVVKQSWQYGLTFTAYGFYDPVVEFTLGGTPVRLQGLTDYTIPGRFVFQPGPARPEHLGIAVAERRDVRVRAQGGTQDPFHGGLFISTRAEDGNHTLPIKVTCRESSEPEGTVDWKRRYPIEVEGWREDVPGLAEARAQCFRNYLDRHRDGMPDVASAAVEIEFTLAGRPGNPLLDPDPVLVQELAKVQANDPRVLEAAGDVVPLQQISELLVTRVRDLVREAATRPEGAVPSGPGQILGLEDILSGIQRPV